MRQKTTIDLIDDTKDDSVLYQGMRLGEKKERQKKRRHTQHTHTHKMK